MTATVRVLVVCTANICRSPMAEVLLKAEGRRQGKALEVQSGGVMGLVGRPADPKAVKVMAELGLDLSRHVSKGLTEHSVAWADHILVMELRHLAEIHRRFPAAEGKVLLMGTFGGMHEIADPVGGWTFRFRKTRGVLQRCAASFVAGLPGS